MTEPSTPPMTVSDAQLAYYAAADRMIRAAEDARAKRDRVMTLLREHGESDRQREGGDA